MPGKVKVTVSGNDLGRVRVIRSQQGPGGEWNGGEELTNEVDPKKGFETELDPGNRIVIEEIG